MAIARIILICDFVVSDVSGLYGRNAKSSYETLFLCWFATAWWLQKWHMSDFILTVPCHVLFVFCMIHGQRRNVWDEERTMYGANCRLWSSGLWCRVILVVTSIQRNLSLPSSGYESVSSRTPEDWGGTFLRNVCNHLRDYTTSQPIRPHQHLHRYEILISLE